ncbi:HEAT repeat domain-containing protein [Microbacterium xanthum]|uniref:HEAT repeat domain-containing protein n=1 Tax=Microbacterium xanthum TaxID=3079794 RepID=UPI002AD3F3AC|nr:HEAT repeat domain-containing protein [Microbacterium sp. KSW-48]MDZ8171639.1 HEAT repeat domain-containing protein [Microbacterium sp. KSW-48]
MTALTTEEGDILQDLAALGYAVDSLSSLRMSGVNYRDAVPVLLEHLRKVQDTKVKGEVVRALSVPWARPAATPVLIDEFRHAEDATGLGLRWTVGNALEVVWDDAFYDELVELASDTSFGRAREMIVLGLTRSKNAAADAVLVELMDDSDVGGHAVKALAKIAAKRSVSADARPGLERKLADGRAWVRAGARRALAVCA